MEGLLSQSTAKRHCSGEALQTKGDSGGIQKERVSSKRRLLNEIIIAIATIVVATGRGEIFRTFPCF